MLRSESAEVQATSRKRGRESAEIVHRTRHTDCRDCRRGRHQCAETQRMAFGQGSAAPTPAQPDVHALLCSAFIRLP